MSSASDASGGLSGAGRSCDTSIASTSQQDFMQAIDYSKISITAKLVAYLRQYSDIPFAEDVAIDIGAEAALNEISSKMRLEHLPEEQRKDLAKESKFSAPILEARYKSIVHLILKTGIKQVLELASGFSLRGLAMSKDASLTYVDTDLPGVNEEKQKLIASLREKYQLKDQGNYHIATANAMHRSELEAAAAVLKRDEPLIIVNEGLLPYLSAAEQSEVADNVRSILAKFTGGAWITPDFTTREVVDSAPEHRKHLRKAVDETTNRTLYQAAFESEEAMNGFIHDHGFTATSSYQTDEISTLVSPERLGLDSQVVEKLKHKCEFG